MKKLYILALALFAFSGLKSQDTFSIIAVDPVTKEIGSAGASCVTGVGASGIIDIITDIIPGRGGVNSQAWVCIPNVNLQNAIIQMEMGSSPQEIIDWLLLNDACSAQNFDPDFRQYGIVDFDPNGDPRTAGFTGVMTDDYKEDRQGATYSIQGNILLNQTVIDNMEDGFNNTTGTLADKLMAAMQGANFPGADQRCLSAGTSSTTAYLLVYREDDDPNDPYIRLNVGQLPSGQEPIDSLQILYNQFLSVEDVNIREMIDFYPNPASDVLTVSIDPSLLLSELRIVDVNGKVVLSQEVSDGSALQYQLNVSSLQQGIYFLQVNSLQGATTLKFVKN